VRRGFRVARLVRRAYPNRLNKTSPNPHLTCLNSTTQHDTTISTTTNNAGII
jgi:hypothetical protein